MDDWKYKDIEDNWMERILKESAMLGRGKVISIQLPAWRSPYPRKKYTTGQRKKRKSRRKMISKSRLINRKRRK